MPKEYAPAPDVVLDSLGRPEVGGVVSRERGSGVLSLTACTKALRSKPNNKRPWEDHMRLAWLLALALLAVAAMTTTASARGCRRRGGLTSSPTSMRHRQRAGHEHPPSAPADGRQAGSSRASSATRHSSASAVQQFAINRIWKDQQLRRARPSAAVKTFRQQIERTLICPIDRAPLCGLARRPKDGAAVPRAGTVAISHVDVIRAKKDDGIAAVKGWTREDARQSAF